MVWIASFKNLVICRFFCDQYSELKPAIMKTLVWIISLFLFCPLLTAQSAWTLEKNHWYTQIGFTNIGPYNELFVNGSDKREIPFEITDNTLQFYGEYGLLDKLTLSLSLPLKFIRTNSQASTLNAVIASESVSVLGNISFGIKRKLYDNKIVISSSFVIDANTSQYFKDSGIRTGYDAWTFLPSISFGKGTDKYFLQGSLGMGLRTNNYSHYLNLKGEVGYKFFNRFWTIFYMDYKDSFENGTILLPVNNLTTSLYVNNQEYLGYGIKVIAELNSSVGITSGFGGALTANSEARKAALNLGVYFKLSTKKNE